MTYQPGPSYNPTGRADGDPSPPLGVPTGGLNGRTPSPLPAVPQIGSSNLGQPGSNIPSQEFGGMSTSSSQGSLHPSNIATDKGPDYVYFERKPNQFGENVAGKATAAKMKLELYYKEAVEGVVGRKER